MGILKTLIERRSSEHQYGGINDKALIALLTDGAKTAAGVSVNEESALRIAAVYICVGIISESFASLPHFVYRRLKGGGKERAADHSLYEVLHDRWNPYMTAFECKETIQAHVLTWGNGYAEIERDGGGNVVNLWPLRPDWVRIELKNGRVWYFYAGQGPLDASRVFHVRGLGFDGVIGYPVITMHRERMGLVKASSEYRARFFANDGRPGGVLEHPTKLTDPAYERLKKDWHERHEGLSNRARTAILEEGMKWKDVGIPPDDAQYIQGEEFEAAQIAALYRVPPYRIGVLKPGTVSYSSTEQQDIDFVKHGIRPWLVRWETRANLSLLTEGDRRQFFTEFLVDALLRGDIGSRQTALQTMRQNGIINADEWREIENMNPLPNGEGKIYLVNGNMIPAKVAAAKTVATEQPPAADPPAPAMNGNQNGKLNGAANV
jgi:HK97 family phage portal protein